MDFHVHTVESAPAAAKPIIEGVIKKHGQNFNLFGVMAEAPVVLETYLSLQELFARTSLTKVEQHVVYLAANFENDCHYCMAAHSGLATMDKVPNEVIGALRDGTPIADAKLQALRVFTKLVVNQRGWVGDTEIEQFLSAGYSKAQVLEVVLGVSIKTLSTHINHMAVTDVDKAFARFLWKKPQHEEQAVAV